MAACKDGGGGQGQPADAPGSTDASPDAPADAPTDIAIDPLTITLTINVGGQPVPGVQTYFVKADGSPADTVTTNAAGVASSIKADGGSATVIDPFGSADGFHNLYTYAGIKAGDHLVLRLDFSLSQVNLTLTVPRGDGNDSWSVQTSCGTGSLTPSSDEQGASNATGVLSLIRCKGTVDILVIGTGEDGAVSALYHPNVVLPQEGDATVDLTADHYKPLRDIDLRYSNIPADTDRLSAQYARATPHGVLGTPFDDQLEFGGGEASHTLVREPANDEMYAAIRTQRLVPAAAPPLVSDHRLYTFKLATAMQTIDLAEAANLALPGFTEAPSFDVASHSLRWAEADSGSTADLTVVQMSFARDPAAQVAGVVPKGPPIGTSWTWMLAAPYQKGQTVFPMLSADGAVFNPIADDSVFVRTVMNARVPGHYDAIRARIHNRPEFGGDVNGLIAAGVTPAEPVATVEAVFGQLR